MPMFRSFVPRKMQPWIYLFIAVTFQLSGGVYLGALNHMIGGMAVMREDILMCMYANLAGMAIYFPLLFRMKFRFTNKTLLTSAALGVLLCNLIAPHITFLPLLWLICFIEGMCKIQGTFECMSNIQLWMTPKRDFTVFFPWLHIVILGSIQLSDLITTYLMFHYHWTYMNLFIAGLMLIVLIRHSDRVKVACLAQLINVIAPIMTDPNGGGSWKQTIFYPFMHASKYGRGVALQPVISSTEHETSGHGSITDIEAVAVYNEEKEEVTVFAVNRNLKEDVVLNTDVRSFEGYRVAEHIVLESDDLKVVNAFGQENVKPKTTQQTTMDNGELTSMLHKASWNVIRLVKDSK